MKSNFLLYRDSDILLANKPSGIPVHETKDPKRMDFTRLLQTELDLPYLRTVNRLDLLTTGIVVFGLRSETNRDLDEKFQSSRKTYLAWVEGIIDEQEFCIQSFLRDGKIRVQTVRSGGKKAITQFRTRFIDPKNRRTLVEADLITGRRHQIRIHLSEYGHPICGDPVYGKSPNPDSKIMQLHSWRLRFKNLMGEECEVLCPPPWAT